MGAVDGPAYLRRLSRPCGVLAIVAMFFAPWGWSGRGAYTWLTLFRTQCEEFQPVLPFRAVAPWSTFSERVHAVLTVEGSLAIFLLACIPAGAAFLAVAPRRKNAPLAALLATTLGTAAGTWFVL